MKFACIILCSILLLCSCSKDNLEDVTPNVKIEVPIPIETSKQDVSKLQIDEVTASDTEPETESFTDKDWIRAIIPIHTEKQTLK